MSHNDIGNRLRTVRELNRYTREYVAEAADISPKFLYELECGRTGVSAENLLRICTALDVSCDYILKGETRTSVDEEIITMIESFSPLEIPTLKRILRMLMELRKS